MRFTSLLLLLCPTLAFGQTSFPMITHTFPLAIQRGQTAEVLVSGQQNFAGVYTVLFEGMGVRAVPVIPDKPSPTVNAVRLLVSVDDDAALGVREFRLASHLGISTLGQLLIVDAPVAQEKEPNNTISQAQLAAVPSVQCGQLAPTEDVDWYRFTARRGVTYTFEVRCARLQDKIHDLQKHADPLITLCDSTGRELAANDDERFADPLLNWQAPADGEYLISIRDSKYDGDPRWVYALIITDKPYVNHIFPLGVPVGRSAEVTAIGAANVAGKRLAIQSPASPGLHVVPLVVDGVSANSAAVVATELPLVTEMEPNDTPEQAHVINIPCGVNGRIDKPRDLDHFRFKGVKGQSLRFEVKARRFGTDLHSPLDSVLDILSAKGVLLISNDDLYGKDAGLTFTPTADGEFILRIRDLNNKGSEGHVYFLEADFAKPDFALRCDPSKAMIGPGASTTWFVQVNRQNGFAGPVMVEVQGLPDGLTVAPLTIPANLTQGALVLTAAPQAKPTASAVTVVGQGTTADGQLIKRSAAAVEEIYLPGGGRGQLEAGMQAVAISEPNDIIDVKVKPSVITLKPGEEIKLEVTITRKAGFDKPVTLDVPLRHLNRTFANPLPPGVTMVDGKSKTLLGPNVSTGHITLKAAASAEPIEDVAISVLAHVAVNFVVRVSYSSPVIRLSVRK